MGTVLSEKISCPQKSDKSVHKIGCPCEKNWNIFDYKGFFKVLIAQYDMCITMW